MGNFDAKTGNPIPRRRWRANYRTRPRGTEDWTLTGDIIVISRTNKEAREFAGSILDANDLECEVTDCIDVTDEG